MTVEIIVGDVRRVLQFMPDQSVHCVVTSPPYWGLRDYGTAVWEGGDPNCDHRSPTMREGRNEDRPMLAGSKASNSDQLLAVARAGVCGVCGATRHDLQIGMESTPQEHVAALVELFGEVKRILRDDGVFWLNYGDMWATSANGRSAAETKTLGDDDRTFRDKPFSTVSGGLKAKDLVGMPWRLALALQADGWWLRDCVIWHKPNPMPSSVKSRCTPSYEYLFMLAKSEKYYFDHTAIMEPIADSSKKRYAQKTIDQQQGGPKQDAYESGQTGQPTKSRRPNEIVQGLAKQHKQDHVTMRAKRNVWTIPTQPVKEAHFATFPERLVEPCILAGSSSAGCCPKCFAPWVREIKRAIVKGPKGCNVNVQDDRDVNADRKDQGSNRQKDGHVPGGAVQVETLGWKPSCACPAHEPIPTKVLDPFGGSGTTGRVAQRLGRNAILVELNTDYAQIARQRTALINPFAE